jgi:O-antigen/teichoic acid export membrane protein
MSPSVSWRSARLSRAARGTLGRLSWGLADQAVSSLTNFAVGAVVAKCLGAAGFGVFTVAWVTYGVIINLSRGLATDPLVVRFSAAPEADWRVAVGRSTGSALAIGVVTGGLCVVGGLVVGGSVGSGFLALGLVLPALMLLDSWRFAFFAAGRGARAFANDLVWAAALVPALYLAAHYDTVFAFVFGWGAAGAVAAISGALQARITPDLRGVRGWLRQHRDLGTRYMIENVSNSGAAQIRMYGLGAIAGLSAVGTVRGAELLLGPFMAVLMGLSLVAVPQAAQVLKHAPHRLPRFCILLGGGQAGAALLWGSVLFFALPDSLGERVLGEVWRPASELIVPATIAVAAAGMCTGAATGLRALGASRLSLRAQLFQSVSYATCGLIGAVLGGALGSSCGVAGAMLCAAAIWWWHLRAGMRQLDVPPLDTPLVDHEEMRTP